MLVRQFVYTMFITNNCASFHLQWKEKHQKVSKYYYPDCSSVRLVVNINYTITLKPENVCKYFIQDSLKNSFWFLLFWKYLETTIVVSTKKKKVKPFHKHCPATIGTVFSNKFACDAKIEKVRSLFQLSCSKCWF